MLRQASCILLLAALSTSFLSASVSAAPEDVAPGDAVFLLGRITATYTIVLKESEGGAENDRTLRIGDAVSLSIGFERSRIDVSRSTSTDSLYDYYVFLKLVNISPENVKARVDALGDVRSIQAAGMQYGLLMSAISLKSVQFAALPFDEVVALRPPSPPLGPSAPLAPPPTASSADISASADNSTVATLVTPSGEQQQGVAAANASSSSSSTISAAGGDDENQEGARVNNSLPTADEPLVLVLPAPFSAVGASSSVLNCTSPSVANCSSSLLLLAAAASSSANATSNGTSSVSPSSASSLSTTASASVFGDDPASSRFPGSVDSLLSATGATVVVTSTGPIANVTSAMVVNGTITGGGGKQEKDAPETAAAAPLASSDDVVAAVADSSGRDVRKRGRRAMA